MSFIVNDGDNSSDDEDYDPNLVQQIRQNQRRRGDIIDEDQEYLESEYLNEEWKRTVPQRDVKTLEKKLASLKYEMKNDIPTVKDVLGASISQDDRKECLYLLDVMNSLDPYEERWWDIHQQLRQKLKEKSAVEKKADKLKQVQLSYDQRIMALNASDTIKSSLFGLLRAIGESDRGDEHSKRMKLEGMLQLPYDTIREIKVNLLAAAKTLDDELYGMKDIKRIFLEIIATTIHNPSASFPIIGLLGPPGVGKTHIATVMSKCMGLEMYSILIGGAKDSTILHGGDNMWSGSSCGQIARGLQSMQISNGVFVFDELDKTCTDIYNSLLHIFDSTTNKHFRDEHFSEVELDLSRCKFIVLMNDVSNIPAPLLNRMHIISVPGYTKSEKLTIAQEYLIPREVHPKIKIPLDVLKFIIENTHDEGVRDVKKVLQRVNMHSSLAIEAPKSEYVLFSKFKLPYTLSVSDVQKLM